MSFLEEFESLTSTAPTVDPELVGWDDNAFVSSKQSQRPYHILDDAEKGKPVARADLYSDNESEIDETVLQELSKNLGSVDVDSGSEAESGSDDVPSDEQYHTGDSEDISSDAGDDSDGATAIEDDGNDVEMDGDDDDNFNMIDQKDDEAEKTEAVKFQIGCWDKLVQLRIKLQPCLQETSKLPPPGKRQKLSSSGDHSHAVSSIQNSLDMLFDLQDTLVKSNTTVNSLISGKKVIDEDEIPSDTEDEESEEENEEEKPARKRKQNSDYYSNLVSEKHELFNKFKDDAITNWYEKTKIVVRKNAFMNKEVTVLDQIKHILSNKDKLITRTLQNRSSVKILGEGECESHPYLFNDDDFYQQILREIIDKKMSNMDKSDPEAMGKQWVELQKLKFKNKKKNVDTKASKGRKVRYDLHSKLLGFMAPVSTDNLSDERQDELFKSLFTSNV